MNNVILEYWKFADELIHELNQADVISTSIPKKYGRALMYDMIPYVRNQNGIEHKKLYDILIRLTDNGDK